MKKQALLENDFSQDTSKIIVDNLIDIMIDMSNNNKIKFTNLDQIFAISSGIMLVVSTKIIGHSTNPKTLPRVMGLSIGAMFGAQIVKNLPSFQGISLGYDNIMKIIAKLMISTTLSTIIKMISKVMNVILRPFISMPAAKNLMNTTTGAEFNKKLGNSFFFHLMLGLGVGCIAMWTYAKKHGVTTLDFNTQNSDKKLDESESLTSDIINSVELGDSVNNATVKLRAFKDLKNLSKHIVGISFKEDLKAKGLAVSKLKKMKNAISLKSTNFASASEQSLVTLLKDAWKLANDASSKELDEKCTFELYIVSEDNAQYDMIGVYPNGTVIAVINPNNTALSEISVRELAAIFLHELGHYSSKHFYHSLFTTLPLTLLQYVPGNTQGIVTIFLESAIAYYVSALGKFHEIQADKYAIERGLGNELASGLKKLVGKWVEKHNRDTFEVHGNTKLRIEAILAESNKYKIYTSN